MSNEWAGKARLDRVHSLPRMKFVYLIYFFIFERLIVDIFSEYILFFFFLNKHSNEQFVIRLASTCNI